MVRRNASSLVLVFACVALARADSTTRPTSTRSSRVVKFPSVAVDLDARQVRVDCESLALVDAPLEFLCVTKGGSEHESVLRTSAKPSHIHAALLMLGLEPGSPAIYRGATNDWRAPYGPRVTIECEWVDAAGNTVRVPAERTMTGTARNPGDHLTWIFAGSHVRDADGVYLADPLGYVVTLVNFEHALIDVPQVASSSNDTLEWRTDLTFVPKRGTPVTMILTPGDEGATRPTSRPNQPR